MKTIILFLSAAIVATVFYLLMVPAFVYGNYTFSFKRFKLAWTCFIHSVRQNYSTWFTVHETHHFFHCCRNFA